MKRNQTEHQEQTQGENIIIEKSQEPEIRQGWKQTRGISLQHQQIFKEAPASSTHHSRIPVDQIILCHHTPTYPSSFASSPLHCYGSGPPLMFAFTHLAFFTSFGPSLLYHTSRKHEVSRTVTNPSSCNTIVNLFARMWANMLTQESMTWMSAIEPVQAIEYCFDSMPACIQAMSLERRTELAEAYLKATVL